MATSHVASPPDATGAENDPPSGLNATLASTRFGGALWAAAMIGLVAMLLGGFRVDGLVPGVLAAIVTGLVSWVGHAIVRGDDDRR